MAIPDFRSLMIPILQELTHHTEIKNGDLNKILSSKFELTSDDLAQIYPKSGVSVFANRVAWAKVRLKESGLIESKSRAVINITDRGIQYLKEYENNYNVKSLYNFFARFVKNDNEVNNLTFPLNYTLH